MSQKKKNAKSVAYTIHIYNHPDKVGAIIIPNLQIGSLRLISGIKELAGGHAARQ